jgi:uncharacterized protein YcbK (DUF882 family)
MQICKIIIFITVFLAILQPANADSSISLPHDGKIRIYTYHLDEFIEIQYLSEDKKWIEAAYQKLNHALRSRGEGDEITIDKRLIELADHLQDHFKIDTIEVISGFRSKAFNKSLKQAGRSVANESFHTKGKAMDIHIDEIKESTLRDYLLKLNLGGVGYYGNLLMVHMDFGPQRKWTGGSFLENTTIGIFNKTSNVSIRSDKLFYALDGALKLSLSNIKTETLIHLQKFSHGKWISVKSLGLKEYLKLKTVLNDSKHSKYGKYRLRYENGSSWQHSNEFYVKKR